MKTLLLLFIFATSAWGAISTPTDAEALPLLKTHLQGKTDHIVRLVRRLGNKTLEVDCFIALQGDLAAFKTITTDFKGWRDWALTDFNVPRDGSGYVLQLNDLVQRDPGKVTATYVFNVPLFSKERARTFKVGKQEAPKSLTLTAEALVNPKSAVKAANAFMKVLPADGLPGTLWINVKAVVEFNNWFFYEALPEKILLREVGDRLTFLVENYEKEELRFKQGGAPRTVSSKPVSEVKED